MRYYDMIDVSEGTDVNKTNVMNTANECLEINITFLK